MGIFEVIVTEKEKNSFLYFENLNEFFSFCLKQDEILKPNFFKIGKKYIYFHEITSENDVVLHYFNLYKTADEKIFNLLTGNSKLIIYNLKANEYKRGEDFIKQNNNERNG